MIPIANWLGAGAVLVAFRIKKSPLGQEWAWGDRTEKA